MPHGLVFAIMCAVASAELSGAKVSQLARGTNALIAGVDWEEISAKSGGMYSWKWNAGVYVRNLPSRHLCVPLRGQKNGVDRALIRPAHDFCHARDLSALIDIAGRDDEEVGLSGN